MMKSTKAIIQAVTLTIAAIAQIVLTFFFYSKEVNSILRNIGWVILWISAVFGWLPIYTFKKWGRVPKGKSYVNTTVLVDRGLYSIIRHPQYFAGILIGLGLTLVAQLWFVGVLGAVVIIICYADMFEAEKSALEQYGDAYKRYMGSVPRMNVLLGIYRRLRRKG